LNRGDRRQAVLAGNEERRRGQLVPDHSVEMRAQAGWVRAEAIMTEEMTRLRWKEDEWSRRAKNDPHKPALAARLRRETTLTMAQIAERLLMGSRKSVAPKLHAWRKAHE
jgi:hypothetical protein